MTKIPKQQTTWSALDFLENNEQETNALKSELERRAELRRKLAAELAKKLSSITTANDRQDLEIEARKEKARKEVLNRANYEKELQRILSQNRPLMSGLLSGTQDFIGYMLPGYSTLMFADDASKHSLLVGNAIKNRQWGAAVGNAIKVPADIAMGAVSLIPFAGAAVKGGNKLVQETQKAISSIKSTIPNNINKNRLSLETPLLRKSNLGLSSKEQQALNEEVARAFSESGQPVKTSSSLTGREFWIERQPANISEAERLGIPKGERNQPQIDFSNRFHPAYTGKEAEDIFKSLYDPNIDGYSFQLRGDVAKARQIYKLSDNISDDVIGNVLEQRWRKILQYPEELTVQEVPEEIALKFLGKTPLELRAMGDRYNRGAESDVIIDSDFAYKFTRPAGSVSTLRSQIAHIMGKNGIGDFMIPNQYLGMVLKNGKYYGVFKQPTVLKVIDYDNFSDYGELLEHIPGIKDGKYTINHAVWEDIRPENIGIDNTGQVRVFDPGFVTNKMWEPHTMNGKSIFANDFRNPVNWQTGGLYEKTGGKLNYLNYINS